MMNVLTDAAERLIEQPPAHAPSPSEIRRRANQRRSRRLALVTGTGVVAMIAGLVVATSRDGSRDGSLVPLVDGVTGSTFPGAADAADQWVGRWAFPSVLPEDFQLRSGLQSDTERILLVVDDSNDATMSISVADGVDRPDLPATEFVEIGDVTASVNRNVDSLGLRWAVGGATLSVTDTRSVDLDQLRDTAIGLVPVDVGSIPVGIETISPQQPSAEPDGQSVIVAGPDDLGDPGPFGQDWSQAPVVEAVRANPLDFAIDTLGWDVGPDDVVESHDGASFIITNPSGDRVRVTPAVTADPSFLLSVSPVSDWSSEIIEQDGTLSIGLADVPLASIASTATVTAATVKGELTTDVDAGADGFDHIDVDPPGLRSEGYFDYLIVFRNETGDAIGALSVGPVSAPTTPRGD